MQQILVLSIQEFHKMVADVSAEISKLEAPNENHNVIIENIGGDIRVVITETPDIEVLIRNKQLEDSLNALGRREKNILLQPATRECPNCGSAAKKKVDRRYSLPVRYWCKECQHFVILSGAE